MSMVGFHDSFVSPASTFIPALCGKRADIATYVLKYPVQFVNRPVSTDPTTREVDLVLVPCGANNGGRGKIPPANTGIERRRNAGFYTPSIICFKEKRAYDEFTSGQFAFDAQASAVAITAGAQAQVGSTGSTAGASPGPNAGKQAQTNYQNGMAIFIHAKSGLMYEAAIAGQKFSFEPLMSEGD